MKKISFTNRSWNSICNAYDSLVRKYGKKSVKAPQYRKNRSHLLDGYIEVAF
jgi:hypothetical protein